jgi:RNA polymerase primary sigma factor
MMLQLLYRCGVSQRTQLNSTQPNPTQPNPTQPNPTSRFKGRLTSATTDCFTPTQRTGGENVGDFLKKIGRVPLLTGEEEIELARKIQAGWEILQGIQEQVGKVLDANGDVINNPGFTDLYALYSKLPNDEKKLLLPTEQANKVRAAKRAHGDMVSANLRLVVSVAKKYQGKGLDLLDLIQEGSLGLTRAVDKFNHALGYKFSTYAYSWIRQNIRRAIEYKSQTIRLPSNMWEDRSTIKRVQDKLSGELKRAPTMDELVYSLGSKWTTDRVTKVKLAFSLEPTSLDAPMAGGETPLLDLIPATGSNEVTPLSTDEVTLILANALGSLTAIERIILEKVYGLSGEKKQTLKKIGDCFSISRERVNQIKNNALKKLGDPNSGLKTILEQFKD